MSRAVPLLMLATLVAGCGGDPVGSSKTQLTFGGVFVGENGTEAGNFGVTIVVEDGTGTGSFYVNGAPHLFAALTFQGNAFVASGAGYVFTGTTTDSTVSGTYTSTSGGGLFTGLKKFGATPVTSYCGTHIGTDNGVPLAGAFAFVQSGTTRRGVVTSVLGDNFRGYLRSSGSTVVLENLTGNFALTVTGNGNFVGQYTMASGEIGDAEGTTCRVSVSSPILAALDGVLGSYDGLTRGNLSFSLSSTGLGSTGTYTVGGVLHDFQAVISGVGSQIAAFDTDFRVIVSQDTAEASGTYATGGSVGGLVATLLRHTGQTNQLYCGNQLGSGGAFSFIVRSDNLLFGLYSGGVGSAFQGVISGSPGDNTSTMSSVGDQVTIVPNTDGSFGGFWDWTSTGHTPTNETVSGATGACST